MKGYLPVQLAFAEGGAPISVIQHGAVDLRIAATNFDLQPLNRS